MKHFDKYLAFCVVLFAGCTGDSEETRVDRGVDYFPIQVGFYQVYTVNEIRYSQVADPDTMLYELLVEVVDSFVNTAGSTTYVVHRSSREDETESWQFQDTWSARVSMAEVVYIEGNVPYVKVTFPLVLGKTWNGNMQNTLEEDEYEVKALDVPFTINGMTFEKTLSVEQEFNDDPIVYTDIRTEVYARNVGMIFKETKQLLFCQELTCSGNELIESGIVYKQEIKEYGVH